MVTGRVQLALPSDSWAIVAVTWATYEIPGVAICDSKTNNNKIMKGTINKATPIRCMTTCLDRAPVGRHSGHTVLCVLRTRFLARPTVCDSKTITHVNMC